MGTYLSLVCVVAAALGLVGGVACSSSSDDGESGSNAGSAGSAGNLARGGTSGGGGGGGGGGGAAVDPATACANWKLALCDWHDRCGGLGDFCRSRIDGYVCGDPEVAQSCASSLTPASCATPPGACDLEGVADGAPAIVACNEYLLAVCTHTEGCTPGTLDSCLSGLHEQMDCESALGVLPAYDQCLQDVEALDCAATITPESCTGIILF